MKIAQCSLALSAACILGLVGCAQHDHAHHADHANHAAHAGQQAGAPAGMEMQLPPGWTQEDMMAYANAGTPGEMHAWLASQAGKWKGKNTMWMAPGAPEMVTESASEVTVGMDGRYTITNFSGDMPGMGKFQGMGVMGYDNVSQKFVSTWIDNQGTGIMRGEGTLSADKKTLTTEYVYNCPITKAPTKMREINMFPDANTMIMEMHATDPKSKVEYKCMRIELKRVK